MSALAAATLCRREVTRFLRQPSRLASAIASPVLLWLFIGSGLSASFRLPGGPADVDFLEYFFPGTLALVVLFAAIFSTISVIEDRQQGFLQGVLVAPIGRGAIVAGKVTGGALLAWLQGLPFLLLAPLAGVESSFVSLAAAAGVLALLALALTGLGFVCAWMVDSTQGFHAVMNLLLLPMWALSGAAFPLAGAAVWLQWIMRINPLTYGVAALRRAMYGAEGWGEAIPSSAVSLTVLAVWCLLAFLAGLAVVRRGLRR